MVKRLSVRFKRREAKKYEWRGTPGKGSLFIALVIAIWLVFTYDMSMKKKPHFDSKKKDILQVAMKLFAEKGVDGVSVKETARRRV